MRTTDLAYRVFEVASVLRGKMDASAYMRVMSVVLVLKWAHDHPTRLKIPPEAQWDRLVEAVDSSPRDALGNAVSALVFSNPDVFDDSFERMDLSKRLSNAEAWQLITMLDEVPSDGEDPKLDHATGRIYDQVLATFMDDGKRGNVGTPRSVGQLMVHLADPRPGQSVYDPSMGTGGLLIAADAYVAERTGRHDALDLFGQDVSVQLRTVAWLNLMLHGVTNASVRIGDAILDPSHLNSAGSPKQFDRVLTNPPFSLRYRHEVSRIPAQTRYGHSRSADLMFVQHTVASLTPDGVGVMAVPNGVLFRGGEEGEIRRRIIQDNRISAVIALGRNLFPTTSVPFSILVLRGENTAPGSERDILFINAEHEVDIARSRTHLAPRHVERIATTFHNRKNISYFSRLVSIEEITKKEFNLNVGKYISTRPPTHARPSIDALLTGGVPVGEVEVQRDRFAAFGIDLADLFVHDKPGYLKFPPRGYEAAASTIPSLAAPTEAVFAGAVKDWFDKFRLNQSVLTDRPLDGARIYFAERFQNALTGLRVLNDEQVVGLFTDWWITNQENLNQLHNRVDDSGTPASDAYTPILDTVGTDLVARARKLVARERNQLVDCYLTWGNQYSPSLKELEHRRVDASSRLAARMRNLGYQWPSPGIEP
ncbi:N-6 DNA methylase [Nocardia sp. NPDC050408]|uniref:N-6 DNA methylase n=1 Tax=Nocardia sp. NPDC050408 TaxID=3364319 RepID=UPI0037BC04BD